MSSQLNRGRLGILSDTHLPKPRGLPPLLLQAFQGVDAILHGGDVVDLGCLQPLQDIAPVYVVMGNNDPPDMAMRFGWRRALRWRGWRFGLVHGDVGRGRNTPQRACSAFREAPPRWEEVAARGQSLPALPKSPYDAPPGRPEETSLTARAGHFDCVVFGHSHQPCCEILGDVLALNPGSPTERRREPRASFVVVEASDGGPLEVRFFYL